MAKRKNSEGDEPEDDDSLVEDEEETTDETEDPVDRLANTLHKLLTKSQGSNQPQLQELMPAVGSPEDTMDYPEVFDAGDQVYTHSGQHLGPGPVQITSRAMLKDLHAAKQRYHNTLQTAQMQQRAVGLAGHTQTVVTDPGPGGAVNPVAGPDFGLSGSAVQVPSVEAVYGPAGNTPNEQGFVIPVGGVDPHPDFLKKE